MSSIELDFQRWVEIGKEVRLTLKGEEIEDDSGCDNRCGGGGVCSCFVSSHCSSELLLNAPSIVERHKRVRTEERERCRWKMLLTVSITSSRSISKDANS